MPKLPSGTAIFWGVVISLAAVKIAQVANAQLAKSTNPTVQKAASVLPS